MDPVSPRNLPIRVEPKPTPPDVSSDIEKINALLAKPWSIWDLDNSNAELSPGRIYEVTHLSTPARATVEALFARYGWRVGCNVSRLNQGSRTPDDSRRYLVFFPPEDAVLRMRRQIQDGS